MSGAHSSTDQAPPCPDPSAHERDTTLQDQASKAALYATHDQKSDSGEKQVQALGADGKLSSAGAAASLKHAKPQDLPSFPSVGIETQNSGNKAATLANQNHKSFEYWKPEQSSNASKAALLAAKDGGKLNLWQPSATETGHSAASIAMNKQKGLSPQLDYGYTDDGHKKALLAATLSTTSKKPAPPPAPSPTRYPDAENASANALNAASVAHKPSNRTSNESYRMSSPANEAARLTHLNPNIVNREMFTEHPPIGPDHGQAALRGATSSMATDKANRAKTVEQPVPLMGDIKAQAQNYLQLQEAAQRLAAERLAKLDPDGIAAYREHYGYGNEPPKSRLSVRNRKGRSSSDGQEDDQAGAKRIHNQMSKFNDEFAGLDAKKRTQDRTSLMAAAEKAVKARMSGIDQDIFEQTGKVTPQMMEQWEAKARAKANANSEKRMENHGLVHIGGGKYMEQSEIDAIAQNRMQPTLDQINETAELRRAREEEVRLDQEQRKVQADTEKQREKDTAAEVKKQKDLEKMQAQMEKDIEKRHQKEVKDHEKAQKKLQKEEAKRIKEQRKEQDSQWKREQEDVGVADRRSSVSSSSSSEVADRGVTSTDTEPVTTSTAAPITSIEEPVAEPVATSTAPAAQDPPGVPTDFGHTASHNKDGKFLDDSGADARKAENRSKTEEETMTGPRQKRESKVKSFFGKFKGSSTKAKEEKERKELENPTLTKGEKAAEAAETTAAEGRAGDGKALVAEPSNDMTTTGTAGVIARDNSPSPRAVSPVSATESARIFESDPPGGVSEELRGRAGRESALSNDNEDFEEAKDKFDEDDGGLKAPEAVAGSRLGKDESPARSSSKFQEEL